MYLYLIDCKMQRQTIDNDFWYVFYQKLQEYSEMTDLYLEVTIYMHIFLQMARNKCRKVNVGTMLDDAEMSSLGSPMANMDHPTLSKSNSTGRETGRCFHSSPNTIREKNPSPKPNSKLCHPDNLSTESSLNVSNYTRPRSYTNSSQLSPSAVLRSKVRKSSVSGSLDESCKTLDEFADTMSFEQLLSKSQYKTSQLPSHYCLVRETNSSGNSSCSSLSKLHLSTAECDCNSNLRNVKFRSLVALESSLEAHNSTDVKRMSNIRSAHVEKYAKGFLHPQFNLIPKAARNSSRHQRSSESEPLQSDFSEMHIRSTELLETKVQSTCTRNNSSSSDVTFEHSSLLDPATITGGRKRGSDPKSSYTLSKSSEVATNKSFPKCGSECTLSVPTSYRQVIFCTIIGVC